MGAIERFGGAIADEPVGVADCISFATRFSRPARLTLLVLAALTGVVVGSVLAARADGISGLWALLALGAVLGGLLSTWSPCGYSSISLLRPGGSGGGALVRYLPTLAMHGLGYALGALILGAATAAIGRVSGFEGHFAAYSTAALAILALTGLVYGIHQLDFLRVPYPQRQAQVPHDARQRFRKSTIGGLYGLALGLNYLTYVQTPVLYLVTLAAVFTGNAAAAIALFALFNLGRFLPMLVNLLPLPDHAIQAWLARNQERAAMFDGALLIALGAALAVLAAAGLS